MTPPVVVGYNGSYLPCQEQLSLQSVSHDASWQLLLGSGPCSLWCQTEGGGEVPGWRSTERWCEKTNAPRQRRSQRADPQSSSYSYVVHATAVWHARHTFSFARGGVFVVLWDLIWLNWWDSGAAIVLSILLCWQRLSDSETTTHTWGGHGTDGFTTVHLCGLDCGHYSLAQILRPGKTKLGFTSEWQSTFISIHKTVVMKFKKKKINACCGCCQAEHKTQPLTPSLDSRRAVIGQICTEFMSYSDKVTFHKIKKIWRLIV